MLECWSFALFQTWILTVLKFLVGIDPARQAMFFMLGFGTLELKSGDQYEPNILGVTTLGIMTFGGYAECRSDIFLS
jgi:hypothetical protein